MELAADIEKKLPGFTLRVNFETGKHILGLLGASGSGKSMILRCIAGLETPGRGRIVLNGRVLFDSERGINLPSQKRKVGLVFQNYALFPNMTVAQNIGFALKNVQKSERLSIIDEKIYMMHLEGLEDRYPYQLSGGQQQRVALARALAIEPEVLLLDEPFSALDEHLREHMAGQLIVSLEEYRGVTLFVTHNIEEAYRICQNLMILSYGKVEACADKEEIFKRPPTLTAAQITGCKNISRIKRVSGNMFEAVDWGCRLTVDSLPDNAAYVGMRAHYIAAANENEQENVCYCRPVMTSEAPFRVTVYLSVETPPSKAENYNLQWEITWEEWLHMQATPLPWRIFINPCHLFFIRG